LVNVHRLLNWLRGRYVHDDDDDGGGDDDIRFNPDLIPVLDVAIKLTIVIIIVSK